MNLEMAHSFYCKHFLRLVFTLRSRYRVGGLAAFVCQL